MEGLSPAVALSLDSPICDSSGTSNHVEITRFQLVTEAASLLSDPATLLHADNIGMWDGSCDGLKVDVNESVFSAAVDTRGMCKWPQMAEKSQDGVNLEDVLIQENKEDEILLVGDNSNGIERDRLLPMCVASESSLPIAVKIEGTDDGQIFAKVISVEERSFDKKLDEDTLTIALNPLEGSSSGPTLKTSLVALQLPNEKDPVVKGALKNIYEVDYVPFWGSMTTCGLRPEMEDAIITAPYFMKIPIEMFIGDHNVDGISQPLTQLTSHFFGVYDGHGGSQVANYCCERIHVALGEELKVIGDNDSMEESLGDTRLMQWEKVFTSCFLKVDNEVGGKIRRTISAENVTNPCYTSEPVASETVGSTAVVAVICSSHIIVANCGDSRAVLYRGKEAVALSVDHKPNREDEYARIEESGGKVIQWNGHRVFGVLAMSRSIGDRYLKPWIIPNPEVMLIPRAKEDECLVLASDGLWDVMTNEEVCEVARRRILLWHKKNGNLTLPERGRTADPAAQEAAEYLTNLALNKGSKDNIAVIVIDLKARRKFKSKTC